MDISEAVTYLQFYLIPAAGIAGFRGAGKVARRWLRLPFRFAASLTVCAGAICVAFMTLSEIGCTVHQPVLYSPDRHHVAIITRILGSALDEDSFIVSVRPWWSPVASRVYSSPHPPRVSWPDGTHLLIQGYQTETGCPARGGGVAISCEVEP